MSTHLKRLWKGNVSPQGYFPSYVGHSSCKIADFCWWQSEEFKEKLDAAKVYEDDTYLVAWFASVDFQEATEG